MEVKGFLGAGLADNLHRTSHDQLIAIFATPAYGGVMTESLNARVRQVLEGVGDHQAEFGRRIGMSADKLSKSLNGTRRFTSLELALIAEEGHTTVDWLLHGTEPRRATALAARTRGGGVAAPDDSKAAALRHAEIIDALAAVGHHLALPELPSVCSEPDLLMQGARLAEDASAVIGLSPRGVTARGLAEQWEKAFGLVAAATDLPDGLDGLSWDAGDFRLVLVGRTDVWTRQRFTLAHELGHILAGDATDRPLTEHVAPSVDQGQAEIRANAFAAELLMPHKELVQSAADAGSLDKEGLLSLSWEYQVSPSSMATRLRALGIITDEQRRSWSAATTRMAALHAGDPGRHLRYAQQASDGWYSASLAKLAISAYVRGDISIRLVATVTGMDSARLLDLFHPGPGTPEGAPQPDAPVTGPAELAFFP
ncbi:XRE family transcriptional regulator [Streptomyces phaeochromogenes]|uniref:helix-turn-helix domain-containing protein n=1 Tax=Streptomyces phaeochromogenes TaxID=1923 RepID=UPI002DD9BA7B|nr:XRE family transcriptional regulator [Streptomyces phaeochromogenes]WRZ26253.1 XRE family transcriptional regulator [Streptomyces phaeochromogenes]